MTYYIEENIINSVKKLLSGQVNELLENTELYVPPLEFTNYRGASAIVPEIALSACEQSEKERIIQQDAYSLTITLSIPETPESERQCYAYAGAVTRAFHEDPSLGGVVDRTVITGKKYNSPKKPNFGQDWEVVFTLRLTVERFYVD